MQPQYITISKQTKDITGYRFDRLIALGPVGGGDKNKHIRWLCQCDCGNLTTARGDSLRAGKIKSCGCLSSEVHSSLLTTHGKSRSHLYQVWRGMLNRCINPNAPRYNRYGGRGILVCDDWKNSFEAFHAYVSQLSDCDKESYTLDRINNDGNYEPGNVRWASKKTQSTNSHNVRLITYQGKTQCLREWSNELGIHYDTLRHRVIRKKWPTERAFTEPVRK